ncbi:hypothetical protein L6258_00565 [Candidatus Parcubacteria bacterium]|nr:hypothetical protein [Candidatus Parcubacteria bacterium]
MAEPKIPTSLLYRIFSLKSGLSKINEAVQKGQTAFLYPQVGQRDISAHLDREVAGREEELRRLESEFRGARGYPPKSDYQYLFVRYRKKRDKNLPEPLFTPPTKEGERDPNQAVWRELVTGGLVDQRGQLLFQPQLYKEAHDEASKLGRKKSTDAILSGSSAWRAAKFGGTWLRF